MKLLMYNNNNQSLSEIKDIKASKNVAAFHINNFPIYNIVQFYGHNNHKTH